MPTPLRNFRADDELWEAAQRTAAERGEESLSAVLVRMLREYVETPPPRHHEHEAWQLEAGDDGRRYCRACGQKVDPPAEPPSGEEKP